MILFAGIVFVNFQFIYGQTTNPLDGLKLAGPGDIKQGAPLMLDPMSTPMYDEQFQKINPSDFMKIMMSNEFIPEPYIDKNKSVKAFVLRKATQEEKAMMLKMQSGMVMNQEESILIGTQAVDFDLEDMKGNKIKQSQLKGKVVVMNFWFIECKPCVMEIPELNELVTEFTGKEVIFLSFAVNKKEQLKKFLKKTEFKYKVLPNGQSVSDSYGVKGFPTNLIIDQNGIIQYVSTGIGPNNKANLLKEINNLLIK
jgi:peroxiredoxin